MYVICRSESSPEVPSEIMLRMCVPSSCSKSTYIQISSGLHTAHPTTSIWTPSRTDHRSTVSSARRKTRCKVHTQLSSHDLTTSLASSLGPMPFLNLTKLGGTDQHCLASDPVLQRYIPILSTTPESSLSTSQVSITGTNSCAKRILRWRPAHTWARVRMGVAPDGLIFEV
jgi:hypothetical protein